MNDTTAQELMRTALPDREENPEKSESMTYITFYREVACYVRVNNKGRNNILVPPLQPLQSIILVKCFGHDQAELRYI